MPKNYLNELKSLISRDTNECINWPYFLCDGYGRVTIDGKRTYCNRASLMLSGSMPPTPKHEAAHKPLICHNRACVNPRHLRWATTSENMMDKSIDGTRGRATLTIEQAREIKNDPRPAYIIAPFYPVDVSVIRKIKNNKIWKAA